MCSGPLTQDPSAEGNGDDNKFGEQDPEQQRDIWFLGDFHVTLDHVPNLGDFVELAVMTDDEASLSGWATRIEALAAELGLSADALQTRSYRAMLAERR